MPAMMSPNRLPRYLVSRFDMFRKSRTLMQSNLVSKAFQEYNICSSSLRVPNVSATLVCPCRFQHQRLKNQINECGAGGGVAYYLDASRILRSPEWLPRAAQFHLASILG